jgi:hypothetical protein
VENSLHCSGGKLFPKGKGEGSLLLFFGTQGLSKTPSKANNSDVFLSRNAIGAILFGSRDFCPCPCFFHDTLLFGYLFLGGTAKQRLLGLSLSGRKDPPGSRNFSGVPGGTAKQPLAIKNITCRGRWKS